MSGSAWRLNCPILIGDSAETIQLAHGEGARATRLLIQDTIAARFPFIRAQSFPDAAHVPATTAALAVTTDSFVASPLFFPGGDLGSLAVHGTVNDLAVSGAVPRWMTVSLILEEGLPLRILELLLDSLAGAAADCGVEVIAGDTKVVPRGAADGVFITATGIGELSDPALPGPQAIQPGDAILVSGPIGRHGFAVLCAREELQFEPPLRSDSASLVEAVRILRNAVGESPRALRDATRGGVSAVLHEWAAASGMSFRLEESRLPVGADVRGAAELLGIDPLHSACEGVLVAAIPAGTADQAVASLQKLASCAQAAIIGYADRGSLTPVTIRRALGRHLAVDEPTGVLLPRIC